jgi:hypothetical protein
MSEPPRLAFGRHAAFNFCNAARNRDTKTASPFVSRPNQMAGDDVRGF